MKICKYLGADGQPLYRYRPSFWQRNKKLLITVTALVALAVGLGAATQINLATQVMGILGVANGGSGTASTLTGVVRGGNPLTGSELSGDATTSGSNAVTVAKVNGTSVATNSAADQVLLTTASATGGWASVTNCGDTSHALAYSTGSHTFSCQSVTGASFAASETPSGTINGSNVTFTLAHTPVANSLQLFKNGQRQALGAGLDYTLATATVTYLTAPATGDQLIADYRF